MLTFSLPEPPSVNRFKNFRRTGGAYPKWKEEAGWEMKIQHPHAHFPFTGLVLVEMVFARPGDIDNRIKPLLDLLQYMNVFTNDKQVEKITAAFGEVRGRCRVTISEIVGSLK